MTTLEVITNLRDIAQDSLRGPFTLTDRDRRAIAHVVAALPALLEACKIAMRDCAVSEANARQTGMIDIWLACKAAIAICEPQETEK